MGTLKLKLTLTCVFIYTNISNYPYVYGTVLEFAFRLVFADGSLNSRIRAAMLDCTHAEDLASSRTGDKAVGASWHYRVLVDLHAYVRDVALVEVTWRHTFNHGIVVVSNGFDHIGTSSPTPPYLQSVVLTSDGHRCINYRAVVYVESSKEC